MRAHLRTYPLPDFTTAIQSGNETTQKLNILLCPNFGWEWSGHGRTSQTGSGAYDITPTSCAILLPHTEICFVFVSCVQRVVEGSVMGSDGCVEHVDVHGAVGCCNVVAVLSMADRVCLACMQKLWSAWAVLDMYGIV